MGALDGLKVLDLTTLLPGPYATTMLGDLGAEILKVSAPGKYDQVLGFKPVIEEDGLTATTAWLGRNKKTILLNLKKEKAVKAVKKLILEYDILVEQFRPGVMKKLGLDYETLKAVNPALIYCSITGYGQSGPLKDRAGHDINYISRSGWMASSGRKEQGPVLYNVQIADVMCGSMNSVIGILAAVHYRNRTGRGQFVDVSMLDGVIPLNTMDGTAFLAGESAPEREGNYLNGGIFYDFYETKDHQYMSVGALEPKFYRNLCEALGCREVLESDLQAKDPGAVKAIFRNRFLKKTRVEWEEIFAGADACVEPVLSLKEAAEDPHLAERGMWPEIELPSGKKVRQIGCPIHLSECPPEYKSAGSIIGKDTEDVLQRLGYSREEAKDMMV